MYRLPSRSPFTARTRLPLMLVTFMREVDQLPGRVFVHSQSTKEQQPLRMPQRAHDRDQTRRRQGIGRAAAARDLAASAVVTRVCGQTKHWGMGVEGVIGREEEEMEEEREKGDGAEAEALIRKATMVRWKSRLSQRRLGRWALRRSRERGRRARARLTHAMAKTGREGGMRGTLLSW